MWRGHWCLPRLALRARYSCADAWRSTQPLTPEHIPVWEDPPVPRISVRYSSRVGNRILFQPTRITHAVDPLDRAPGNRSGEVS